MTVLQGSGLEHRKYRPGGGYIGQGGDMLSYVFIIGDRSVRMHSKDTSVPIEATDSPGPVLFELAGENVTERMVRSISPKSF
jgi:hypothetical protein